MSKDLQILRNVTVQSSQTVQVIEPDWRTLYQGPLDVTPGADIDVMVLFRGDIPKERHVGYLNTMLTSIVTALAAMEETTSDTVLESTVGENTDAE